MRQNKTSAILNNATNLRNLLLSKPEAEPGKVVVYDKEEIKINATNEVKIVDGLELQDILDANYRKYGVDDTIVICRSNKRANAYNQQIRARVLDKDPESTITAGDLMMVVKNNYNWLGKESSTDFIANGDIIQIKRVKKYIEMHGFNFASVTVKMLDFPNDPEFDCNILLDTIMADSPALPNDKNQELYKSVVADYIHIENAGIRFKSIKADPFLNALQVKFAYAVTCHKAQGGQWQSVFVEQAYLPEGKFDRDYLRWLYTAFSRATQQLNLIGFDEMCE
jgi:exodeoxyribonuclease-5